MKKNKIKTKINSIKGLAIGTILVINGTVPVYASPITISGMDDVKTSMQNIIQYTGVFFMGAGAMTALYGAYKLFQSIKSQDSESRSSSIIEVAAGVASIVVGAAANTFAAHIV